MLAHTEPTIVAMPRNTPEGRRKENAARDVLSAFVRLPLGRLLCFFGSGDWPLFKDEYEGFGKANRAVSGRVRDPAHLRGWPPDLVGHVFPSDSLEHNDPAFDFVIFIHNSTCEDPVGLTMTFAHELQHFIQWATMPAIWKTNERFKRWCLEFETDLVSHELPIEKDARIIAKRIAIRIHGPDAVNKYIEKSVAHALNNLDKRNWRFIADIEVAKPYDVEVETMLLDNELKSRQLTPKTSPTTSLSRRES